MMRFSGKGALGIVIATVLILGGIYAATLPHLFLTIAGDRQDLGVAKPGRAITLHYRHSVQQTHVREYLVINDTTDGFVLTGTKYRSYGVGLPFLQQEGTFRTDGKDFYLEHMHRAYPSLSLRVGVGTELSIQVDDQSFPIYQKHPPGTLVTLVVVPWWKSYFM